MYGTASTQITMLISAAPGEVMLKRTPDQYAWSLAQVEVIVYQDETDGVFRAHLTPRNRFRAYRERDTGGWAPNSPVRQPKFAIRLEMLPDNAIRAIQETYAQRLIFGTLLPEWDVVNGKAVL